MNDVRVVSIESEMAAGNPIAIALVASDLNPRGWLVLDNRLFDTESGRGAAAYTFHPGDAREAAKFAAALLGDDLFRRPMRVKALNYEKVLARAAQAATPYLSVSDDGGKVRAVRHSDGESWNLVP